MAQEFNIPGLKEAIADIEKLNKSVNETAKNLLTMAINSDKAMKEVSNNGGVKDSIELQKKAKEETDKLEVAKKRLQQAESQLGQEQAKISVLIQKQMQLNKSQVDLSVQLNESLKTEITTIAEARAQNALLTQVRNNVNTSTDEGKAKLLELNTALDFNNKFIKENADGALKQKMNIGNYTEGMTAALEKTGLMNTQLGQMTRNTIGYIQSATQATKGVKDFAENMVISARTAVGFQTASKKAEETQRLLTIATGANTVATESGVIATETSAVATEANVIATESSIVANEGLAVAETASTAGTVALTIATYALLLPFVAIIAVAGLLFLGLSKLDPIMDKLEQLTAGFGGAVSKAAVIVTDFVTGLTSFGDAAEKIGDILLHPIDSIKSFSKELGDAAIAAAKLKEAEQDLGDMIDIYETRSKNIESQINLDKIRLKNRNLSAKEEEEIEKRINDNFIKLSVMRNDVNDETSKQAIQTAISTSHKLTEIEKQRLEESIKIGDLEVANKLLNAGKIETGAYEKIKGAVNSKIDLNNKAAEDEERTQDKIEKARDRADKAQEARQKKAEEAEKKELDRQKKTAEEAIKTMKITLDNEIATYDQSAKLDEENIAHVQAISLMKQSIANAEMAKNLIGVKKGSQDEISIRNATTQEITKIENEKTKALENIQSNRAKFELDLYDVNTQLILDQQGDLTDLLINEQKNRIKESLELHKDALREELKIDKDTTDEKLKLYEKTGAKLSENETKYLSYIKTQEAKAAKDSEKINKLSLDSKLKAIDTEEKAENRKFILLGKAQIKNNINELKNEEKKLKEERKLYAENSKEVAEIDLKLAENKQKLEKIKSDATKQSLQMGLDTLINIAGQESDIGKAAAIAKVTMSTIEGVQNAYTTAQESPITVLFPGYPALQAGLAGLFGATQIAKIVGVDMFAEGTNFAPYTGKAIVDEVGAEIHTDKYGNIKSFGSNSGAHLTDIVKGDKIIPADISAIIRQTMFSSYGMTAQQQQQTIDYNKIGEQFGKHASKIVNAVNNNGKNQLSVVVQKGISDRVIFRGKSV